MGNYTIVISGVGSHHNKDYPKDANVMAAQLVHDLKQSGHSINSAVFNYAGDTKTDDLDALTRAGNETLLHGGVAGGGMITPNAMKVFKFEAKEGDRVLDTLYVQGETVDAARQTFKDRGFDDMPDDMLTVTEVEGIPEGEELLNPA